MKNMQKNSSIATIGDMLAAQGFVLEATEQGIQKVEVDPGAPRPRRKTKVKYAFPEATYTRMPRKPEMLAVTNKELGITVEFPIFNKTFTNTLDGFGNLAREQKLPPYIGFWEKNKIRECFQSLSVELMLQGRNGLALPLGGIYAPVAVSAEMPAGYYKVLNDSRGVPSRILVNEGEMALQAVDSDGDRCAVLSDGGRQGETVAFIKIPFTSQAPILKKFEGAVFESFADLDFESLNENYSDGLVPYQYQTSSESTTGSTEGRVVMSVFDQFIKNHTGAPVGIITTEWNALECQNFLEHGYEEGVKMAFETLAMSEDKEGNPIMVKGRFQDVEGNGLKLSRKDDLKLKQFCYEQFVYPKLSGVAKGLLSSASGIRRLEGSQIQSIIEMDKEEFINRYWKVEGLQTEPDKYGNADLVEQEARTTDQEVVMAMIDLRGVEATRKNLLQQVTKRASIRNLSLYAAFYDVINKPEAAANVRIVLNDLIESKRNKGWKLRDGGLISRLIRDGMMTITNLPVNHISGLPLQVVELTRNGKRIALFDQKREGNDLPEKGIGYHYLLVPVFDKTLNQWVDGKTAMQHAFRQEMRVVDKYDEITGDEWQEYEYRCFDKYDFLVKNPETNEAVRGLGVKKSDWDNIPVQVTILQEAISSYLGKCGMLVNGAEDRKTISEMSMTVARNVVTINYGRFEEAPEKMWSVFEEATKQLQVMLPGFTICPGNKQQNPLIRKYVLGRTNGTAVWSHPEAHMSRPGKNQSQLSRALLKMNARIALVDTTTQTGGWASTQGVEAQKSDKCFYPQVMQDPEEAREYAESEGIEFEKLTSKIVHTWTGGQKQIWLKEAKEAIELGKFVDARFSLKFMPAPLGGEVLTSHGEDVHFVIPITEIIDKGSLRAMMSAGLREETITITECQDGEERTTTVKALIIETPVYRSGSHSENTPAKVGTSSVSGFDQFAVRYPLMKMGWSIAEPHMTEFTGLQKFINDLRETVANA